MDEATQKQGGKKPYSRRESSNVLGTTSLEQPYDGDESSAMLLAMSQCRGEEYPKKL